MSLHCATFAHHPDSHVTGLSVHLQQVHKETLTIVDNALPNRQNVEIEIFGMEGMPEDILQAHNQRVTQEFYTKEANRRAISGNPGAGGGNQGSVKKPKLETPAEIKQRLAEFKAKKAAQQAAGGGADTPSVSGIHTYTEMLSLTLSKATAGSPQAANAPGYDALGHSDAPGYDEATPPHHTGMPPQYGQAPPPFGQAPPNFGQPPAPYGQPPPPFGQQQSPFGHQPSPFGQQQSPVGFGGPGFPGQPPHQQGPFPPPPGQFGQPLPQFPPPQHYGEPNHPPTGMGYAPTPFQMLPSGPMAHMPGFVPPPLQPQQPYNQRPTQSTPASAPGMPIRQNSLPTAPGLPQRPAFNAPPVSRSQLNDMHHGHAPGHPVPHTAPSQEASNLSSSVDDLISSAQNSAQAQVPVRAATPAAATPEPSKVAGANGTTNAPLTKSIGKKQKLRMMYNDPHISPEEKMAAMPRYAFTPKRSGQKVLGPIDPPFTGVAKGPDDVMDAQR